MSENINKRGKAEAGKHESHRPHLISFSVSIVLTLLAFYAVASDLSKGFTAAFIIALALIQAIFQAVYWMHLNQKGHVYPLLFLGQGLTAVFLTILACTALIWW